MIYKFICELCHHVKGGGFVFEIEAKPFHPPTKDLLCPRCNGPLQRIYGAQIDTSGCKDPDFIKPEDRVFDATDRRSEYVKEGAFQKHIAERRSLVRQAGHNPKAMRMTHSVPADLFHGKIRATGDKEYWNDPANLKKHTSCKVD